MSTGPHDSHDPPEAPARRRIALRVLAVVASMGAIAALWLGEREKANHDLQLIVQRSAAPGQTVALRALLLQGMESVRGPRLAPASVRVSLRDGSGEERAHADLEPDVFQTMGGELRIPELAEGTYVLDAVARLGGAGPARCRRAFHVRAAGGELEPTGRIAGPLQHVAQGPLRTLGEQPPPSALEARIPGGVCIPETPCEVWVRVGSPPSALRVDSSPSVGVEGAPAPRGEVTGLVRVLLVVHGPEAEARLRAVRGGQVVAERMLRLPVGLGEVGLSVQRSVLAVGARPRFAAQLPPGRNSLILDAFRGGDWRRTAGFTPPPDSAERWLDWPSPELGPGLWRLQARTDPFSSDGSGTRVVYVRPPGMDDAALLRALDLEGAAAGDPPVFDGDLPLPAWAFADIQQTAAYLLAPLETQRMPQPAAVSGRPAQLERLSHTRNLLRFSVGAMLLLSAFVVSGTMVRRELGEQALTRSALREAGDVDVDTVHNRRRQAFWLWSMALGVALAFVLAALLIVAKPLWF